MITSFVSATSCVSNLPRPPPPSPPPPPPSPPTVGSGDKPSPPSLSRLHSQIYCTVPSLCRYLCLLLSVPYLLLLLTSSPSSSSLVVVPIFFHSFIHSVNPPAINRFASTVPYAWCFWCGQLVRLRQLPAVSPALADTVAEFSRPPSHREYPAIYLHALADLNHTRVCNLSPQSISRPVPSVESCRSSQTNEEGEREGIKITK